MSLPHFPLSAIHEAISETILPNRFSKIATAKAAREVVLGSVWHNFTNSFVIFFFCRHPFSKRHMGSSSSFYALMKERREVKLEKVVFHGYLPYLFPFSQPCVKLVVKLFYQTIFAK